MISFLSSPIRALLHRPLTLAWYANKAVTGQITRIAMLNATALPTPCEVASACRKVRLNLLVVSSHRWIAVVQMTRISVRT